MTRLLASLLAVLLLTGALAAQTPAAPPAPATPATASSPPAEAPDPAKLWADATAALAAASDPARPMPPAKAQRLTRQFERLAALPALSDHDRARIHANLARAYDLAADPPRARLALLRAEHLFPALPGLAHRLDEARAKDAPGSAPRAATHDAPPRPLQEHARALALSIPRNLLFTITLAAWSTAWALVLLRLSLSHRTFHGLWPLCTLALFTALSAEGLLAVHHARGLSAARTAVVLETTTARTGPDTLTFPTTTELPAATEVLITETRTGADGRPWSRIQPMDAPTSTQLWLPTTAIEPVLPP